MRFTTRFDRRHARAGLALAVALAAGCASQPPARFADGVLWIASEQKVNDAKTQRVNGYASLRMDATLLDRLDALIAEPDLGAAREGAKALVDDAHALALRSTNNELRRVDDAGWRTLTRTYFAADVAPDELTRQQLAEEFSHQAETQAWFVQRRLDEASDLKSLRAVLTSLRKSTAKSVKANGGIGRAGVAAIFALPARMAQGAIHSKEETCQGNGKFATRVDYRPAASDATPPAGVDANDPEYKHWDLLARFAPTFVQETKSDAAYAPSVDQLGAVTILDDAGTVNIDVDHPTVYAYARQVLLNRRPHVQLIYAIWYPEHPKLKGGVDAEAGKIDGATVRITLDADGQPAVVETLNNCGCHHRVYATDALERAAVAEYATAMPGKGRAIERDVGSSYDLILPHLLQTATTRPTDGRLFVRCRAGTHAVVDVNYADQPGEPPAIAQRPYVLRPYAELEALKAPSGKVVSMFLDNGLVRGAQRLEGAFFTPLGMLSAGQPRQRGTQLIQWDQYYFDEPRLLEKTLRLPKSF